MTSLQDTARGSWPNCALVEGPALFYGRDYDFVRLRVRRNVADAYDQGAIELVSYVYRPVRNDRRQAVLFSHGSTGGLRVSPQEPLRPPASLINFFVSRGYTFVAPMRRGVGESSGTFIAECDLFNDQTCTRERYIDLAGPALADAIADTLCVIDEGVLGHLVPARMPVILVGQSRGGFLSLAVAAARRQQTAAVVNFAGGWLRLGSSLTPAQHARSMELVAGEVERSAQGFAGPTLWFYGARDSFYDPTITVELFDRFRHAGGRGTYHLIEDHPLPDGHHIVQLGPLWAPRLDAFLASSGLG